MRTRSKSYPINSNATIPRRSNKRRVVEPEIRTIEEIVPMVDRTMEELLHAPTEGYGEAVVIPEILAKIFEIKTNLLQEECCIKFCEKQKQNMEDTLLELLEVCRQKEFYCMHNNVDDLIESALNSKPLSINLKSKRLDKKKQEVKNVVEQSTKCGIRIAKSLQNFRVIHKKSSTSLNNTSQNFPVHAIAPVLPTKDPEYSLSMGYEHLSTNPEMESDEIIKSNVKNPLLIPNVILREKLLSINRLIADIEFLNDNPTPDHVLNSSALFPIFEKSDNSYSDNSLPEMEETRNGSTTIHTNNSFLKVDLFLASNNSIPPGIRSIDYDLEGDIYFLEELLVDDSILFLENESSDFDHQDDLSFPRPPLKPPDVESFFDLEPNSGEVISAVKNNIDELNEDKCFDPGGEIDVFTNVEDDDYFLFIFVIRIFLPYLIYPEVSSLLLSIGSEDTIFDPGISLGWNFHVL
nr:hypothetical protein [Tanacetum cinerariifolium]